MRTSALHVGGGGGGSDEDEDEVGDQQLLVTDDSGDTTTVDSMPDSRPDRARGGGMDTPDDDRTADEIADDLDDDDGGWSPPGTDLSVGFSDDWTSTEDALGTDYVEETSDRASEVADDPGQFGLETAEFAGRMAVEPAARLGGTDAESARERFWEDTEMDRDEVRQSIDDAGAWEAYGIGDAAGAGFEFGLDHPDASVQDNVGRPAADTATPGGDFGEQAAAVTDAGESAWNRQVSDRIEGTALDNPVTGVLGDVGEDIYLSTLEVGTAPTGVDLRTGEQRAIDGNRLSWGLLDVGLAGTGSTARAGLSAARQGLGRVAASSGGTAGSSTIMSGFGRIAQRGEDGIDAIRNIRRGESGTDAGRAADELDETVGAVRQQNRAPASTQSDVGELRRTTGEDGRFTQRTRTAQEESREGIVAGLFGRTADTGSDIGPASTSAPRRGANAAPDDASALPGRVADDDAVRRAEDAVSDRVSSLRESIGSFAARGSDDTSRSVGSFGGTTNAPRTTARGADDGLDALSGAVRGGDSAQDAGTAGRTADSAEDAGTAGRTADSAEDATAGIRSRLSSATGRARNAARNNPIATGVAGLLTGGAVFEGLVGFDNVVPDEGKPENPPSTTTVDGFTYEHVEEYDVQASQLAPEAALEEEGISPQERIPVADIYRVREDGEAHGLTAIVGESMTGNVQVVNRDGEMETTNVSMQDFMDGADAGALVRESDDFEFGGGS